MRPFPEVSDQRVPMSTSGGHTAVWARDGTELFYMSGASVMAVSLEDRGETLVPALRVQLFDGPFDTQQMAQF